uniref:Uncharacterized protein n=1 Tax=Arundo donax TaxID=35708 RepID=A0A0A9ADV3_ARUDO
MPSPGRRVPGVRRNAAPGCRFLERHDLRIRALWFVRPGCGAFQGICGVAVFKPRFWDHGKHLARYGERQGGGHCIREESV